MFCFWSLNQLKTSSVLTTAALCMAFAGASAHAADYVVAGANTATNGDGNPNPIANAGDTFSLLDGGSISTGGVSEHGIYFNPADGNVISNAGAITTTGGGANGIYVVYVNGSTSSVTVNNSGTIQVSGSNSYGIWIDSNGFTGSTFVTNSGAILAANAGETAITFSPTVSAGNDDTLVLLPGSQILGRIIMDGNDSGQDTVRIVGGGLGQTLEFEEFTHGIGGDQLIVEGVPALITVDATNSITTVTTLDISSPGSAIINVPDVTRSVSDTVSGRIDAAWSACGTGFARSASGLNRSGCSFRRRASAQDEAATAYAPSQAENGASMALNGSSSGIRESQWPESQWPESQWQAWGKVFGGMKDRDASSTTGASRHGWIGLTMGADKVVTDYAMVGAYAGYSRSMLDFDGAQSDIDSNVFFGGIYSRLINSHNVFADLDFGLGYIDGAPGTRLQVNNLAATGFDEFTGAEASGFYIAPSVRVGAELAASERITLVPSARLSWLHQWREGYTESGPSGVTGAVRVDDHRIAVISSRFELAARMSDVTENGQVWGVELRGGVDISEDISEDIDFTFVGAASGAGLSANVGPDEMQIGGFVGASAVWSVSDRLSLNLDSELNFADNDAKEIGGALSAGFRMSF